jgi:hypothetical protein
MRILGLSPGGFAVVLLLGIILAFVLFVLIRRLARFIQSRQEAYRNSEAYYFRSFKRAARGQDVKKTTQSLYRWIDELHLPEPSIAYFVKRYGTRELQEEVVRMTKEGIKPQPRFDLAFGEWKKARKNLRAADTDQIRGRTTGWINP